MSDEQFRELLVVSEQLNEYIAFMENGEHDGWSTLEMCHPALVAFQAVVARLAKEGG